MKKSILIALSCVSAICGLLALVGCGNGGGAGAEHKHTYNNCFNDTTLQTWDWENYDPDNDASVVTASFPCDKCDYCRKETATLNVEEQDEYGEISSCRATVKLEDLNKTFSRVNSKVWKDGVRYTVSKSGDYSICLGTSYNATNTIAIRETYKGLPVKEIKEGAFKENSVKYITSVSIPDSVTSIGWEAFAGCSGLTSVTIPDSVTSIGGSAFLDCSGLTTVNWNANCTSSFSSSYTIFKNCTNLTTVNIGNNVDFIPSYTFKGCAELKSVRIGSGVTSVGESAFGDCSGLKNVYYTGDIANWCRISFSSSTANPTYNGCNLYIDDELIIDLIIPDGIKQIKEYTFAGCSGLKSLTIPNSVTSIDASAFAGCSGLTTVNWNAENCTEAGSIMSPIFENCTNLTTVNFGDDVTNIPKYLFYNCRSLTSAKIGSGVTNIGAGVFSCCSSLREVILPNSLKSMGTNAFPSNATAYFEGTQTEYKNKFFDSYNMVWKDCDFYKDGRVYYYSETQPASSGKYWHYVNDAPVKW